MTYCMKEVEKSVGNVGASLSAGENEILAKVGMPFAQTLCGMVIGSAEEFAKGGEQITAKIAKESIQTFAPLQPRARNATPP